MLLVGHSHREGRVRALERYMPKVGDYRKYYRHYLSSAWDVFNIHRDDPERALFGFVSPLMFWRPR